MININHRQKQRIRSHTSEKMDLLQLKESSAQLEWLLKTHSEEYKSNISMQTLVEIGLQIDIPEYNGLSHMIKNNQISKKEFQIYSGFLIYEMDYCINLNNCYIQKRKVHQQHNTAFILSVKNKTGNLFLIYSHPLSQTEMFTYLKKYAKQSNFTSKFRIKEVNFQNFYQVSRKKTRKIYTAQLFNKQAIICQEQIDILDNYLKIIRSENIPNYLKMESLYEDNDMIYLLTEQFQGISFDEVLKQNRKFNQFDLANIIHDILYTIKAQDEEDIFHGNISINNIVLAIQNNKSQVYLINSNYKSYTRDNLDYYFETIPSYLIAPELQNLLKYIRQKSTIQPSTQTDLYSLGVTLALISFSTPSTEYSLESIDLTMKDIYQQMPKQEARFIKQQPSQFKNLFSSSQLDLIKQLIIPQPEKRITAQEALNHHWFMNIKEKIKQIKPRNQVKRNKLPSLKTIIEIREQSELDVLKQNFYKYNDPTSILSLSKKASIQFLNDVSPMMESKQESYFGDFPSQCEYDVEEEHQLGSLIGNLNNLEYKMLPSQTGHQVVNQQFQKLSKLSSLQQ